MSLRTNGLAAARSEAMQPRRILSAFLGGTGADSGKEHNTASNDAEEGA